MEKVHEIIWRLGIPATYLGQRYLIAAIQLAVKKESSLVCIKNVYEEVAAMYGVTTDSVIKAIRTVIRICWNQGHRAFLQEMAGFPLLKPPTPATFISIIVTYLLRNHAYRKWM